MEFVDIFAEKSARCERIGYWCFFSCPSLPHATSTSRLQRVATRPCPITKALFITSAIIFTTTHCKGIVFLTYGAHNGLMVSLEETNLPWCEPNYINSLTGATNPYDGWRNTNILMSNYDLRHYPAIQWSHKRNTWHLVYYNYHHVSSNQWYVPSSSELSKLLQNQALVNATLDSLGYPTLEDKTYWSSTETGTRCAATVRLQDGQIVITDSLKNREFFVRAIRAY